MRLWPFREKTCPWTKKELRKINEEMSEAILCEIGQTLERLGCAHGHHSLRSTPPMMYPEWILCVVRHAVKEARKEKTEG